MQIQMGNWMHRPKISEYKVHIKHVGVALSSSSQGYPKRRSQRNLSCVDETIYINICGINDGLKLLLGMYAVC